MSPAPMELFRAQRKPPRRPIIGGDLWQQVVDHAEEICECTGECDRKICTSLRTGRCIVRNVSGHPLHAVPREPVSQPAALLITDTARRRPNPQVRREMVTALLTVLLTALVTPLPSRPVPSRTRPVLIPSRTA